MTPLIVIRVWTDAEMMQAVNGKSQREAIPVDGTTPRNLYVPNLMSHDQCQSGVVMAMIVTGSINVQWLIVIRIGTTQ